MMEHFCKAFTCTSRPPLIICDRSLESSPLVMGTEIFHLGLSEALSLNPVQFIQKILLEKNPIENNDGTTETLTVITESANSRQWIDDLIKAKNENIALIINSTDFDELSMALGIALTGTRIVAVICLNHNALECYIQTAKALGVIFFGVNVISCPTCGRCHQELESIVKAVKEGTSHIKTPLTIAIMGCEVNGPGEAKHADIGIASSKTGSILFKRGKKIKVLDRQNAAKTLIAEAEKMCNR